MQERRKQTRRNVSYYLRVIDTDTGELIGQLVDINSIGLMIDCQELLPIGMDYNLSLDLTEEAFDKPFLSLAARCKWHQPDKLTPNFYNIGFEFINLTPEDAEIIQKIVEVYGAQDNPTFDFKQYK